MTFSDYANDDLVDLWLVLEEVPETQDAYKIVYDPDFADDDPEFGGFGLAYGEYTKGADYIGVYGSFLSAYDGM